MKELEILTLEIFGIINWLNAIIAQVLGLERRECVRGLCIVVTPSKTSITFSSNAIAQALYAREKRYRILSHNVTD